MCLAGKDVCADVNEMLASSERYDGWPDARIRCVLRIGFDKYMMTYTYYTTE